MLQVDPIPHTPAPGGLLDVATIREGGPVDDVNPDRAGTDTRWQYEGVEWAPECYPPAATIAILCDDSPEDVWTDPPTGWADQAEAVPFDVYHVHSCGTGGRTMAEQMAEAEAALVRGEGRTIEAVLERGGPTVDGSVGTIPHSLAATATPLDGGPTDIANAIAGLESAIGWEHGTQGVIHLARSLAILAAAESLITLSSGRFRTALGTPVVVGDGYLGGPGNPADGVIHAYATSPLVIYRSAVSPIGDATQGFDRLHNTAEITVHRRLAIAYDCGAFRIGVSVPDLAYLSQEPDS